VALHAVDAVTTLTAGQHIRLLNACADARQPLAVERANSAVYQQNVPVVVIILLQVEGHACLSATTTTVGLHIRLLNAHADAQQPQAAERVRRALVALMADILHLRLANADQISVAVVIHVHMIIVVKHVVQHQPTRPRIRPPLLLHPSHQIQAVHRLIRSIVVVLVIMNHTIVK
jgi:hypothetical protein